MIQTDTTSNLPWLDELPWEELPSYAPYKAEAGVW